MYQVAGHCFCVAGESLCKTVGSMDGFDVFSVDAGEVLFSFVEGDGAPEMAEVLYQFSYEEIVGTFGNYSHRLRWGALWTGACGGKLVQSAGGAFEVEF